MTARGMVCWVALVLLSCKQGERDREEWWPDGSSVFDVLSLDVPQGLLERSSLEGRKVGAVEMVGGEGSVVWRRSLHGRHPQLTVSRDVIDGPGCVELFGRLVDGFSLRLGPPGDESVRIVGAPASRGVSLRRGWFDGVDLVVMCTERNDVGAAGRRVVKLVAVRQYRDGAAESDGGEGCVGACDVIDVLR